MEAKTKPGSSLCKPGTIALFGNVVYSGLLNEHFWHFGVPLVTRLVDMIKKYSFKRHVVVQLLGFGAVGSLWLFVEEVLSSVLQ
ncbi:hypothetical protein EXN66_Car007115 [Channa argus]|uniref:Uncharacterized protein n=1 Tax=Channa argus TaxID=215402 RepID=A0A6G1PMA6_CHAAH|nr:hypothetical protein EXN66_Car007115 [Channa argus]